MAFPHWPGDVRLPSAAADSYFTAQALQAGYPVDPIARYDLAAPPPFSAQEVLQRELQRERIREEYLTRELAHSRLILDQHMRHQQELEAASRVVPAPAYPSLVPEFRAMERLPILAPHPVELGFRESLPSPVPRFLEAGIDRWRPGPRSKPVVRGRHSAELRPEDVIRKQRSVGHGAARGHESKLLKKASGIKRKAAIIEAASAPPSQDKSEWNCSICQVFVTSEHELKEHLNGRRHKVKQESLCCDVCKVRCTNQAMLNSHLNGKRHKEASVTLSAKETCTSKQVLAPLPVKEQQQVNQLKQVVQKSSLNCDVCNLKCNNEFMLNEHLNGKKHKAQLKRSKAQGEKPVSAEDNKLANDKQHGKAPDGEPVTAEGPKFVNDKPVTAEQTGEDNMKEGSGKRDKPITIEENILAKDEPVVSEDKSFVTTGSSGQDGKPVTPEESGEALTPVTATKRRVVVKKVMKQAAVGNMAVEEPVKTGPGDTEVSVVGSVAAETTESDQ